MVHFGPFLDANLELFWTFFRPPVDVSTEASTFKKHYKNQRIFNIFEVVRAPFSNIFYRKRFPGTDLFRGRFLDPVLDHFRTEKVPNLEPKSGQEAAPARQKLSQKSDPKTERKWSENGLQNGAQNVPN